jgi:ADP-ribose pyrophosphatase
MNLELKSIYKGYGKRSKLFKTIITKIIPMKIPEHATRVFKGIIYDVYQWEQVMFDGSKEIFEATKRPDSVQVIVIDKDNNILLSEEEQPGHEPYLGFFGGRVEDKEEPLAAAKRELLEETGLSCDKWEHVDSYPAPGNQEWNAHLYIIRNPEQTQNKQEDPGEKVTIKKVTIEEFAELISRRKLRAKLIIDNLITLDVANCTKQIKKALDL